MTTTIQSPDLMLAQTLRAKLPVDTVTALLAYPNIAADLALVLEQPPLGADYVGSMVPCLSGFLSDIARSERKPENCPEYCL